MNKTIILIFSIILLYSCSTAQNNAGIKKIDNILNQKVKDAKIAGAVILVSKNNELVHHKAYGYQNINLKTPMDTNSIFRIYSMTKPITSVAVMMLAERNYFDIDDPIGKYIPELKNLKVYNDKKNEPLNNKITIRDLLRHTAGFTYGLYSNTEVDRLYRKADPVYANDNEELIKKVSELPLLNHPGEKYHYSIATDILGVLIERVSGETIDKFFRENIFNPLDMKDTYFTLPESDKKRFCTMYDHEMRVIDNNKNSMFLKERNPTGGGGLVSTASDYYNFCKMLLNKGIYNDVRILSETSVEEMTKNQLKPGDTPFEGINGIGFGLGFSIQLEEWGLYGHKGDFGWSGMASTYFYVSPKENIIVVGMTQLEPYSIELQKELKPVIYKYLD